MQNMNTDNAKKIWREADAVCFDVDSTVVKDEGIDELAKYYGKGEEVAQLTKTAMKGDANFRDMLLKRLEMIPITKSELQEFISKHPPNLTPGIEELIKTLKAKNTAVYLVSGGFRQLIYPIAEKLGIPEENVYANKLLFENDKYIGIDLNEPTSKQMGKAVVISELKKKHNKIIIIGDGATDAEASPPADAFIGFGGNVQREAVKARANWYVTSFQELLNELKNYGNQ